VGNKLPTLRKNVEQIRIHWSRTHVLQVSDPSFTAHPHVVDAFLAMRQEALLAGIELSPYSSFRDFDTQLCIWNDKIWGKRRLYDADGEAPDFATLSERDIVKHILYWRRYPARVVIIGERRSM
jgi:LAS superfamily LD-carboxypeptidase LdcB